MVDHVVCVNCKKSNQMMFGNGLEKLKYMDGSDVARHLLTKWHIGR